MINLTDAELEEKLVAAFHRSRSGERSKHNDWLRLGSERTKGFEDLLPLEREAAARGILFDIYHRNDGLRVRNIATNQDLIDLIVCMRENCATRGFLSDVRCLERLEELLACRRVMRRQVLTGEDVRREWGEYQAANFDEKVPRASVYEAGLRRGFAMRAEERPASTPKTETRQP